MESNVSRRSFSLQSLETLESLRLKWNWLDYDAAHVMLVGVAEDSVHVTFVAGIGFVRIFIPSYVAAGKALIIKMQEASIL